MQGAMAILRQRLGEPRDTGLLELVPQTCELILKGTPFKAGNVGSIIMGFSPTHLAAIRKFDMQLIIGHVPNPYQIARRLVEGTQLHTLIVTPTRMDSIPGAHILHAPRHILHAASATYTRPSVAVVLSPDDRSCAIADIIHIVGSDPTRTIEAIKKLKKEGWGKQC